MTKNEQLLYTIIHELFHDPRYLNIKGFADTFKAALINIDKSIDLV